MLLSRRLVTVIGALALVAAASASGLGKAAAQEPGMSKAVARPATFAICAACHSIAAGRNGVGPSLASIAGRKAATLQGYTYSNALKNSGITWDAASLDRWLTSPQRTVPGTKMPFTGISDPARRREVVNYLLTLK